MIFDFNILLILCLLFTCLSAQIYLFQIAKEEEKGVYLNFLNFLINDSIYLLDESLNKILELKELEAEMANTAEWERRPAQERQERTRLFHSQENVSMLSEPLFPGPLPINHCFFSSIYGKLIKLGFCRLYVLT